MKAIVCSKYGSPDVLQLQEVAKPAPQDDEVLIRIHAASVNARDWRMMRAKPFFIRLRPGGFLQPKNKILGTDAAGRVESAGSNVKQFKSGDEVFGYLPSATGHGTFAEYVCANENTITLKPANLTFEQAAAVPVAALTALQGLRDKGNIQPGQKVLINGAAGGVGTFASSSQSEKSSAFWRKICHPNLLNIDLHDHKLHQTEYLTVSDEMNAKYLQSSPSLLHDYVRCLFDSDFKLRTAG